MSRKNIILLALVVIVVGGAAIIGYYSYQNAHYVSTDNARVASDVVRVSPEIVGNLTSWNVREGDIVQVGQVLGRQDLQAALSSSALNPASLGSVGAVLAQKAIITAPIAGQIIQSNAIVGEMAAPGTILAVIADTDQMYISADIKEVNISKVHIGEVVDVSLDAFPGRTFPGRVDSIGRATASTFSLLPAQNDSGNYTKVTQVIPIKIHLVQTFGSRIMIGMNASIRIHVGK
ncbi:MAG TPA: efflux RND transporter periplasmic adaptor subunit [Spirochaetia bacterium]|nr:efflux RND transporter periplasmic adaptor subunit [Spirochaetia bacterium]